ncbi:MAG: VWA domain-containing protein [Actinomycetota bacterium]
MQVSRRRFLQLLGYGSAVFWSACTRQQPTTTTRPAGAGGATTVVEQSTTSLPPIGSDLPFAVWEEILAAVRTSPDHLTARADRLVTEGDAQALFEFVRDEIITYPARAASLGGSDSELRWGVKGTLRGGAGTPREKVDLLADLLTRAGFEAEVWGGPPVQGFDPREMFSVRPVREFAPQVEGGLIERWHTALGIGNVAQRTRVDSGEADSLAIATEILTWLPPDIESPLFDWSPPAAIPFVRLVVNGQESFANPTFPSARYGESYTERGSRSAAGVGIKTVEVALLVAVTTDPSVRNVVALRQWKVDDLIGRRVTARFLPAGDPVAGLLLPAESVGSYTPVISLDAVDLSIDELADQSVVGTTVTLGGDLLVIDVDGNLAVNGEPFGADPEASEVANLQATVNVLGFPTVRLSAVASDAGGQAIYGVPASAFRIEEEGVAVPFQLRQTRPPRPRVLLLLDTSASLPAEFLGVEAGRLAGAVAVDVLTSFPDAEFRTAVVLAGRAVASPRWTSDPAEVEADAARGSGHASEIWSAAADTRFAAANVVVLITDGQSTDTPEQVAAARPYIATGPPIICLGVGEADMSTLNSIAELSAGAAFGVAAQAEAVAAIGSFLEVRQQTPLAFEYHAPEAGPSTRTVRLSAAGAEVEQTYSVPPPVERVPPAALAGIYLRVRLVGVGEVLRTIAGIPHEEAAKLSEVTSEMRDEVRSAVLGVATLTVEGAAPTLSAWLDDMLTAKLTLRPLVAAMTSGDALAMLEALSSGRNVPTRSLIVHPALTQGEELTFETGPRFVLLTSRPVIGAGALRKVDVLPLTTFATVADDRTLAFRRTVERTARLAAVEAALYSDSTEGRLSGRSLTYLPPLGGLSLQGPLAGHARIVNGYPDRHRLHPEEPSDFAFWTVDENGTVLGVLPDGSGGGASLEEIAAECKETGRKAAVLQLGEFAEGLPYAAVVSLQKAISTQILRYAAVVTTIENPQVPEECGGLGDLGCDLVKDTLSEVSDAYKIIDTFDDIAEAAGAGGIVPCP